MKTRKREKITPIHLEPSDGIELVYKEKHGKERVVLTEKIGRAMTVDEVVIFDVEPGDFGENVEDGIGGAFLSTRKGDKE